MKGFADRHKRVGVGALFCKAALSGARSTSITHPLMKDRPAPKLSTTGPNRLLRDGAEAAERIYGTFMAAIGRRLRKEGSYGGMDEGNGGLRP
jgi:hypothetical protein